MVVYVSGLPPGIYDHDNMLSFLDGAPIKTSLHIDTDPATGVGMVSLYR